MATMSIRIADDDKMRADVLFKALGLTTNAAINMFIKQCIRTQGLPFTPTLEKPNDKLKKALEESDEILEEIKNGERKGHKDTKSLFKSVDR